MTTRTRLMPLGERSYLREVVDEAEHVIESAALTARQAAETGLPMPKRPAPTDKRATVYSVLLRLLWERRGGVVGSGDVEAAIGRRLSRTGVSAAAKRLAADLPVESVRGPGGGYRLRFEDDEEVAS